MELPFNEDQNTDLGSTVAIQTIRVIGQVYLVTHSSLALAAADTRNWLPWWKVIMSSWLLLFKSADNFISSSPVTKSNMLY